MFRQAEAGKAGAEPVNWWIVGGIVVGAAVVIHQDNKKDKNDNPPSCFAIKVTIPRPVISGDVDDTDVFGGQQYGPLGDLEVPEG